MSERQHINPLGQKVEMDAKVTVVDRWQVIIQGDSKSAVQEDSIKRTVLKVAQTLGADNVNATFKYTKGGPLMEPERASLHGVVPNDSPPEEEELSEEEAYDEEEDDPAISGGVRPRFGKEA